MDADDYEEVTVNRGITQRIILIAANFRKEVTSTVLWLLNFKLRVQCFRVTPFSEADQYFLNVEQIIPTKDLEEFIIGIADKSLDEVEGRPRRRTATKSGVSIGLRLFGPWSARPPFSRTSRPAFTAGLAQDPEFAALGLTLPLAGRMVARKFTSTGATAKRNTFIFDQLHAQKDAIEAAFGGELTWEPLEGKQACRIKSEMAGNIFDRDQWPALIEFMTGAMVKMENAFREPLAGINRKLRNRESAGLAPVPTAGTVQAAESG